MFRRIVGFNDELERNASSEGETAERAAAIARSRQLFALHPVEILALLETGWQTRVHTQADLGHPDHRSDIPGLPGILSGGGSAGSVLDIFGPLALRNREIFSSTSPDGLIGQLRWDHLIYAYMIEGTGVCDIFKRVIHEFVHGEKLGVPTPEAHLWLRNTEQLFYSTNPFPLLSIGSLTSDIRPDFKATFYNACWRMFGMDSAYTTKESKPYNYVKAEAYNSTFVQTFEYFLWEVWQAIINRNNTSGADLTDPSATATRADHLHDKFRAIREGGNLARVEFWSVSMMAWFHLTLSFDSPIVVALRAEASSPQDRLKKIAVRVGAQPHKFAKNFFDMAEQCSRILILIESGAFNDESDVPALYQEGSPIEPDIRRIIINWSILAGKDIKRQMPVGK